MDNDLSFTRHFMTPAQRQDPTPEDICALLAAVMAHEADPTWAVFYDYNYFLRLIKATGLELVSVVPPRQKNFQWEVWLERAKKG